MLREALLRLAVVLAGVSCSCGESAAAASHENCRWLGQLPCSWGGCDFSLAPNGSLSSTGQCARETSTLYLDQKAIKYFAPGVFKGMRGMSRLRLNGNELQAVPQDVFSDLVNLTLLTLHSNNIASLPVAVFSNLRRLSHLYLYDMPLACANMSVQEQAALSAYWGPPPCPLGCGAGSYSCFATYGLAGLCHDLCTPCPSGKYSAATGATSVATCKDCAAGKHSGASATSYTIDAPASTHTHTHLSHAGCAARSGGGGAANHTQPLQRAHRAWLRPFLSVPTASPVAQPQRPPGRPGADSVAWHQAGEEKTQACGRPWRACANLRTRWDRCVCVCVLA